MRQSECAMSDFDEEIEKIDDNAASETESGAVGEGENGSANNENNGGEEKPRPFYGALGWVNNVIAAVAVMLVLNLFVFRIITVDGTSMCDTLQDGDRVFSTNLFYEPAFGDIVVLQADKLVNNATKMYGEVIIKRVIGVAGDTVRVDFDKGEVYRNGELLQEDYIKTLTTRRYLGWMNSGEDYVVPENCVFVMGDNRNVSHDSRDLALVGFINKNLILGKAFVRVLPISQFKWL